MVETKLAEGANRDEAGGALQSPSDTKALRVTDITSLASPRRAISSGSWNFARMRTGITLVAVSFGLALAVGS